MRINRPSDKRLQRQLDKWKQSDHSTGASETTSPFNRTLENQQIEHLDLEIQDLVDELNTRGEALINHPSLNHIREYQQALASFLEKSLELSRALRRTEGKRNLDDIRQGRERKEHVIVETIDETMDELARAVLSEESNSLDLTDRVGELQGLVVDLVSRIRPDSDRDGPGSS